jgi:hypothetical protein
MDKQLQINTANLRRDLAWLNRITDARLKTTFDHSTSVPYNSLLTFNMLEQENDFAVSSGKAGEDKGRLTGYFLYESDLKTVRKNSKGFVVAGAHGYPFTIIEENGENVRIRCKAMFVKKEQDRFHHMHPDLVLADGWVKRNATTVPPQYRHNMTTPEVESVAEFMPGDLLQLMREDAMRYEENECLNWLIEKNNAECFIPPVLERVGAYAGIVNENQLDFYDRLLLILSLAHMIDLLFLHEKFMKNGERITPLAGGVRGANSGLFIPSGQTFLFLSAGNDPENRLRMINWLYHKSILTASGLISFSPVGKEEFGPAGAIVVKEHYLQLLLVNQATTALPQTSHPHESKDVRDEMPVRSA